MQLVTFVPAGRYGPLIVALHGGSYFLQKFDTRGYSLLDRIVTAGCSTVALIIRAIFQSEKPKVFSVFFCVQISSSPRARSFGFNASGSMRSTRSGLCGRQP
jgi:hypothetical protein